MKQFLLYEIRKPRERNGKERNKHEQRKLRERAIKIFMLQKRQLQLQCGPCNCRSQIEQAGEILK